MKTKTMRLKMQKQTMISSHEMQKILSFGLITSSMSATKRNTSFPMERHFHKLYEVSFHRLELYCPYYTEETLSKQV